MELQRSNPKIKYLRKLLRRQFRQQEKRFIIEGVRFVEELLQSRWQIEELVYCPKLLENRRGAALLDQAGQRGISCWQISDSLFKELAETETPQGIMAQVRMPDYQLADLMPVDKKPLLVLVDGVQDPGNLGTIIRSADAAACTGVVLLKGTVDLYNPKTLRSTMGSLFHLPVITVDDSAKTIVWLKKNGIRVVVGQPQDGELISQTDLTDPIALVVGNEADGPSELTISLADERVSIPMPGNAESLNAGVACAIMLYETVRQRMQKM